MLRHSPLPLEGFIVVTENNYEGKTPIATEFFYVATEGIGCRSFPCRDISFYVATWNGHNKCSTVATEFGHDRRNLSRQGPRCTMTYGFIFSVNLVAIKFG